VGTNLASMQPMKSGGQANNPFSTDLFGNDPFGGPPAAGMSPEIHTYTRGRVYIIVYTYLMCTHTRGRVYLS
jgi:hypothetical protein